jgi:Protein of unknown function (DUF3093)
MANAQSGAGAILFAERQWTSRRIVLICLAYGVGLGVVACLLGSAVTDTKAVWTSIFPWFVGIGVAMALFFWTMNVLRKLEVRQSVLRIGRTPIAYGYIQEAYFVNPEEAKTISKGIEGRVPKLGLLMFMMTRKEWNRIHGNWWQPWMKDAIFVQLKPGSPVITDKWLIGTRHPQQLLELIQAGMARATAPAEAAPSPA